jgi:sulfhydrogenase subunit beta (sulfur reductase)
MGDGGLVIGRDSIGVLIDALRRRGFTVIGPTMQSQAIVYGELESDADLPAGWTDAQEGGTYRVSRRDDDALFAYNAGPNSWKSLLFPPTITLWKGRRGDDGGLDVDPVAEPPRYAFIGVRSCDLHAIAIQDRVFMGDRYVDHDYEARRRDNFIVAVNCGKAGGTCFCVSMGTGPKADSGFDLSLTELIEDGDHRFLVEVGSDRGAEVLGELTHREATAEDEQAAQQVIEATAGSMGRTLDTDDIKGLLYGNLDHPRWDEVSQRCLTCGNCTLVCPTCFCSTVEDVTDLAGTETERTRRWDSCFTFDHSYIHGGSVRDTGRARYRQWMTHKLASWIDQFGSSGCVGCGRCITWCPVAIDITEETAAIRATDLRDLAARGGSLADD